MNIFRERMLKSAGDKNSRVVLALDVTGPYDSRLQRAEKVLDATRELVAGVKLNNQLILPFGLSGLKKLVETCRDYGIPIIADLKMNDIESTNLDMVESLSEYGVDAVIANPFVGRDEGLGKAIDAMHAKGGGVILLVYMSHAGSSEGYAMDIGGEPAYRVFARRARDWGADGVIVSAKAPERIRETRSLAGRDCLIFCPGVGAQGGDFFKCLEAGADFLIVGRAIVDSEDPAKAAARFRRTET